MLLAFFLSVFGLMIAFRTVDFLISNQFIDQSSRKTSVLCSFVVLIACQFAFRHHVFIIWLIELVLIALPIVIFQLQETIRRAQFQKNIIPFLDSLIVQMRSGRTLRESVQELGQHQRGTSRYYLQEILSFLQFQSSERKKPTNLFFDEVLRELVEIHNSTHKAVEKMKALRRKLKTEADFRQKSSEATLQIRMQTLILGVLFIALLGYSLANYDFASNKKVYAGSILLFVGGVWINFRIPKRFRWKV